MSPATINKELRHLRAVFRRAHRWGYLPRVPEIEFLKEPKKLPVYVPPDDFVLLYAACEHARLPKHLNVPAADWCQALLVKTYMTGWRIGALLALRRDDVDLEKGTALSQAEDNKGKRDTRIPLHPIVIEHISRNRSFSQAGVSPFVFPWEYRRERLYRELRSIQEKGGIKPAAGSKGYYTFHDFRRAFATMNADKLTPDVLQALMQHKDYTTTQRYINMARQLNPAVNDLFVPDLPSGKKTGS